MSRPKGSKLSEETRKLMSEVKKNKTEKEKLEIARKISEAKTGKKRPDIAILNSTREFHQKQLEGKLAKNGGEYADLRQCPRFFKWRKDVLTRDNFTCQKCSITDQELYKLFLASGKKRRTSKYCIHAHHIKSWEDFLELRYEVSNGQSLCSSCHQKEENKRRYSI
jgi:hypothetical protein